MVDAGAAVLARIVDTVVNVGLAVFAGVTRHTETVVLVQHVSADAAMLTGVRAALVDVDVTAFSTVAWSAVTNVLVDPVLASAVDAGIGSALVDIAQAPGIVVTSRTLAFESVNQINADTAIGARI